MLLTRQMSAVWFVLVVASVLLAAGPRTALRRALGLRRHRGTWVASAVIVVAGGYGQYWYRVVDAFTRLPDAQRLPFGTRWRQSLGQIPDWTHEGYAVLGWLDAPGPVLPWLVWVAVLGIVGALGIVAARGLPRHAPLLTVLAGLFVSVTVEAALRNRIGGPWWQGRYVLPYLVGLPLLSGALAVVWRWERKAALALVRWTTVPLAAASTLTFSYVVYRYGAGLGGPWWPWKWSWQPPGTVYGVTLTFAAGSALFVVLLLRAVARADLAGPGPWPAGAVVLRDDPTGPVPEAGQEGPQCSPRLDGGAPRPRRQRGVAGRRDSRLRT